MTKELTSIALQRVVLHTPVLLLLPLLLLWLREPSSPSFQSVRQGVALPEFGFDFKLRRVGRRDLPLDS